MRYRLHDVTQVNVDVEVTLMCPRALSFVLFNCLTKGLEHPLSSRSSTSQRNSELPHPKFHQKCYEETQLKMTNGALFHPLDLFNQQKTHDQLNYYDLPKTSPIHFVCPTYCATECTLKQGGTTAPRWQWCHYKSQISPKKANILKSSLQAP